MSLATLSGPVDSSLQVTHQPSLFGSAEIEALPFAAPPQQLDEDCWFAYQPQWLSGSDQLFEKLRTELPWRATERPMYDRVVPVPRLICNVSRDELAVGHELEHVFFAISELLSEKFLRVGANYYRTGQDSVAWHRDTLGRTGRPSVVALVALGSPRRLALRPYRPKGTKTADRKNATLDQESAWLSGAIPPSGVHVNRPRRCHHYELVTN